VKEIHDRGVTGNFEVVVDGKLVHSKTTMGHDRCESRGSTQRVLGFIKAAMQ